jgi:hypothetical protein
MGEGGVMSDFYKQSQYPFNPYSNPIQPRTGGMQLAQDPEDFQEGVQGQGGGQMGGMGAFMKSPYGQMLASAGMGMGAGRGFGESLLGAGMGTAKNELLKYGLNHALGGAMGGQALGALGGPMGMAAMAALPMISKGFSSLGKSLGLGGRNKGPSQQEIAMGQAKSNLAGMRGTYGADMGAGQALRDKYNPMLENQIGRMQELADRGLSTEYNTRQMAGAAANTEASRRAAEARMQATSGMIGGGQALSGFGGINQAAIGAQAQGGYNAAMNNMNQQPGYIQAIAGMAGSQINRGDNYYNQGRSGMMGLDQNLYNLNAQEKARADAMSQQNRDREANMIGGVMNMAGTAMGMEQSRRSNNDYLTALGLRGQSSDSTGVTGNAGRTGATDTEGIAREILGEDAYNQFNFQNPDFSPDFNNNYNPQVSMPSLQRSGPRMPGGGLAQYNYNNPIDQDELEQDYRQNDPRFATVPRYGNPGQFFDPRQFGRDFTGR